MLVISAGMQKSGSGYFYNVINELIATSGSGKDARDIKEKRCLDGLMKTHNNNIGKPRFPKLFRLWKMTRENGTFVVKTHAGPTISHIIMPRLGLLRTVYCYRDPRDALLSSIDRGKWILAKGENHTFSKLVEFGDALKAARRWVLVWQRYANMPGVLTVKYEEMMQDPTTVTQRIESFLGISVDSGKRQEILWRFSKDNPGGDRRGMHFNKPTIFRYKSEMTEEQRVLCKNTFRYHLEAMGYDPE